jgi:hypothetical protein
MLQTNTLNFVLRLERKSTGITECQGDYYIELSGETPFNVNKTFSERFFCDSAGEPFFNLADVARFSEQMASFWESQLLSNPKLAITSIEEIADLWKKFSADLFPADAKLANTFICEASFN